MADNLLDKASILLTPTAYDNGSMLSIKPENGDGDFDFQRNSAATRVNAQGLVENVQIISPELVSNGNFSQIGTEEVLNGNFSQEGSELVTNGDFATDSDWTKGTGWTISGGSANYDGVNAYELLRQGTANGVVGKTYLVKYDVINNSGVGGIYAKFGGVNLSGYNPNNGSFEFYITAVSTDYIRFTPQLNFTGSIDNVSVKEVGQDWTLGTGWSIGENKSVPSAGSSSKLQQSISGLSGKTCKVSFTLSDYAGSGIALLDFGSTSGQSISANGTYTEIGTYDQNYFQIFKDSTFEGSITNISVKEVGQDWTFGTGASMGDGVVIADGTGGNYDNIIYQDTNVSFANKKVKINFDVLNYVSGKMRVSAGNSAVTPHVEANGSYEFISNVSAGTDILYFISYQVPFNGSIDNVSVKEITDDTNIPRINYEGFSYQDSLGSELVVNGGFDSDTAWSKGAGWSISNGTASHTGGTTSYLSQSILDPNKQYKVKIKVSQASGSNFVQIYMGGSPASVLIQNVGEYEYIFTSQPSIGLGFALRGAGNVTIDNVSVKEYLGQEVVPDSGCGSWLLEPQSTNLVVNSNDSFEINSGNILYNNAISPDGTQNAYRFESTGASGAFVRTANVAFSTTSSFSVFLKYGNNQWYQIINSSATGFYANVDIQNGVFGTSGSQTENLLIKDYGNGWYRVSGTFTNASGNGTLRVYASSSGSSSWAGASASIGSYNYGYGFQVENQYYSTSYIPTNGATNTRLQDIANNSGNSSLINSTEGTLFVELAALANDYAVDKRLSISDGTTNNRVLINIGNGISNIYTYYYSVSGSNQINRNISVTDITQNHKLAVTWKTNEFKIYLDGSLNHTDTSGSVNPAGTFTQIQFADGDGTSTPFHGKVKALVVYKEALTDANLKSLTYPNPVATTFDLDFDTIAEQFTFTRGSEATFVNAQGLIESTNQIGSELVTNGDFATDSDWNKGTGWSINGGKADSDGSGNYQSISQSSLVSPVGKTYKVTYEVSDYVSGEVRCILGGFTLGQITSSNGVVTEYLTASNASSNTFVYIETRGSGFIGSIDNVSVKEYTTATNTPRIDYSTGEKAFLLEPQSTNTILNSNSVSTINYSSNITKINNAAISPDGTFNAMSFTPTTTQGIHRSGYHSTAGLYTQNDVVTFSGFVKANGYDFITMGGFFGNEAAVFNVSNGTLVSQQSNVISTKIVKLTNDWYRLSVTYTFQNSINNGYLYAGIYVMDTETGYSFTGDGVSGVYGYGNQAELGTATSYIPTNGASATRNQETCVDATPVINSEEGTLYAEISKIELSSTSGAISISDSTTSNRIVVNGLTSSIENRYSITFKVNNTDLYSQNITLPFDSNGFAKLAIKWSVSSFSVASNGQILYTENNNFSFPINTLNRVGFDSGTGLVDFYGRTKDLKIYPKALADVQLEDLTTI